jgi:hypothetical protein
LPCLTLPAGRFVTQLDKRAGKLQAVHLPVVSFIYRCRNGQRPPHGIYGYGRWPAPKHGGRAGHRTSLGHLAGLPGRFLNLIKLCGDPPLMPSLEG